jgi:Alpha/beta hydrolase of unknown function (DUF900)
MSLLGELSVRVRGVGGAVADRVTPTPADWLLGRRHVVLFVHGFNDSEQDARTAYGAVFRDALADVGYFFWPGDARGGRLLSSASYPFQIQRARDSARRLADYLRGAFGPEGTPMMLSVVGHSLGCRLVLEALRLVVEEGLDWPQVRLVCLMAAAVPTDLVEEGAALRAAAKLPTDLVVYYSFADDVLHFAFPAGQEAAYRLGVEAADYHDAVGRFGRPQALGQYRYQVALGHSGYWASEEVAATVSRLLGAAVPRALPERPLLSETGPEPPALPEIRETPARALPSRP